MIQKSGHKQHQDAIRLFGDDHEVEAAVFPTSTKTWHRCFGDFEDEHSVYLSPELAIAYLA